MILRDTIVEGLLDGKAKDVVCLDMRKIDGSICDYFVIGHGDSTNHIEGINRAVYKKCIKNLKEKPWKEEGKGNSEWILMDYVSVIAHIFYKDTRPIYNLEELWGDAPKKEYQS